jgi:hypothetical protein
MEPVIELSPNAAILPSHELSFGLDARSGDAGRGARSFRLRRLVSGRTGSTYSTYSTGSTGSTHSMGAGWAHTSLGFLE